MYSLSRPLGSLGSRQLSGLNTHLLFLDFHSCLSRFADSIRELPRRAMQNNLHRPVRRVPLDNHTDKDALCPRTVDKSFDLMPTRGEPPFGLIATLLLLAGVQHEPAEVPTAIIDHAAYFPLEYLAPVHGRWLAARLIPPKRRRNRPRIATNTRQPPRHELDVPHQHRIPGTRHRPPRQPRLQDRQRRLLRRAHGIARRDRDLDLERPGDVPLPDAFRLHDPSRPSLYHPRVRVLALP